MNQQDIPVSSHIFTNRDGNTLMKEFEGILENNPQVKNLDAVVGFLRASGYFTLRPFLNSINKVRILIGIDVDKYIARAHQKGELFFGAEEEVKEECLRKLKEDIEQSDYATAKDILELVMRERQREFFAEGKRWFDLVRMAMREGSTNGMLNLLTKKYTSNSSAIKAKLATLNSLYNPVYREEMKVNPALVQNPAWITDETIVRN